MIGIIKPTEIKKNIIINYTKSMKPNWLFFIVKKDFIKTNMLKKARFIIKIIAKLTFRGMVKGFCRKTILNILYP